MSTDTDSNLTTSRFFSRSWEDRLGFVVDLMRDVSRHTDPQELVQFYGSRMKQIIGYDHSVSLSRRDLVFPFVRVTRSSTWDRAVNPWKDKADLPLLDRGVFSDLIYREEPVIIDELNLADDDPAAPFLPGVKSLFAIPMFDQGRSLNMVISASRHPFYYPREQMPEYTWLSTMFGRMTHNLVLNDEVQRAYNLVDRELQAVAEIQRSLLPSALPKIPTLELAAHYSTSAQAGGDYYDFFPLADGRWGILIADVAGHGTPAAVLMAVTHAVAHACPPHDRPAAMLEHLNRRLCQQYTRQGTFITAFYGIYDPARQTITYSSAGHPPPRVKCLHGELLALECARSLPLGIEPDETFTDAPPVEIHPGDAIVFYTDGITETRSPAGELFGTARLDTVLRSCSCDASVLIDKTLKAVNEFSANTPAADDRTMLIARVR